MIVVVLVAAGERADPVVTSLEQATRDALGPRSVVELREASTDPVAAHPEAERTADATDADAVAVVTWASPERSEAHIEVLDRRTHRWSTRDVRFAQGDPPTERGREIGYGLTAMLPTSDSTSDSTPVSPPPAPPRPTAAPAPVRRAFAIDALGVAATGALGGVGAGLGLRFDLTSAFALRIGSELRFGSEDAADASYFDARFDAGFVAYLLRAKTLDLGLRADLAFTRFALHRSSVNGDGSRVLGGGDALAEVAWSVTPALAFVGGLGLIVEAGHTDIVVDGATLDRTPLVRGTGELGVRVRF